MKDVSTLTAADVMHSPVWTVSADESLQQLQDRLAEKKISGMPVVEDGHMVGIISEDDIIRTAALLDTMSTYVYSELLTDGPMKREAIDADHDGLPDGFSLQGLLTCTKVRDAMAKNVITCRPDTCLEDVMRLMSKHHIHRVVVTENDGPVGIISTLDVISALIS